MRPQALLAFALLPVVRGFGIASAPPTRREMIRSGLALGATTSVAALLGPAAVLLRPAAAVAAGSAEKGLVPQLVLILRVQEATSQETRLVSTGKYKELQRLNVKRAIRYMLDNYSLEERFNRAAAFAPREKVASATAYGANAAEALNQIIEYFPQDLVANDLTAEQKRFVLRALATTSNAIDSFLALMPAEAVARATEQVVEENRLNELEFVDENGNKASILNAPAAQVPGSG